MSHRQSLVLTTAVAVVLVAASTVPAQDAIRGWGTGRFDTSAYDLPTIDVDGGQRGLLVLRADGRLVVQGSQFFGDGPAAPSGVVYTAVAMGSPDFFGLALRSDGQIATWGSWGSVSGRPVPALPATVGYLSVAAGGDHSVAQRSDGVVVAWGGNTHGQTSLPPVPPGAVVLTAHAGSAYTLLLLSNGTILGCGIPTRATPPPLPAAVTYVALWGGPYHAIAQRSDGAFVDPAIEIGIGRRTDAAGDRRRQGAKRLPSRRNSVSTRPSAKPSARLSRVMRS